MGKQFTMTMRRHTRRYELRLVYGDAIAIFDGGDPQEVSRAARRAIGQAKDLVAIIKGSGLDEEELDAAIDDEAYAPCRHEAAGKPFRLWWVSTPDHDEDWAIVARTRLEARWFHADMEDYDLADVRAKPIADFPPGHQTEVGWPSDEDLAAAGAVKREVAPHRRELRIGGRCFLEGDFESRIREADQILRGWLQADRSNA